MTAEEMATEEFVDREIGRLREELKHVKELWMQQVASDAAALILRTANIEKEMQGLNHAHAAAREVQATTVDSKGYEVRMTELQVQLQGIKDVARDALGVSVADFARQLLSAQGQVATNKEEIEERFDTLKREVTADLAYRAGAAEAISATAQETARVAKEAARSAKVFAVLSAFVSALVFLVNAARVVMEFFWEAAP